MVAFVPKRAFIKLNIDVVWKKNNYYIRCRISIIDI